LVKEAQFEPLKILLVGSFLIFLGDWTSNMGILAYKIDKHEYFYVLFKHQRWRFYHEFYLWNIWGYRW
jgi:hypothetical protein